MSVSVESQFQSILSAVEELKPLIDQSAETMDRERRLPRPLAAARALLYETMRETTRVLESGEVVTDAQRTRHFLFGTHATLLAAQTVDLLWSAAGTAGIFQTSPSERRLRDMRVVAQHPSIAPAKFGDAGRRLLGVY